MSKILVNDLKDLAKQSTNAATLRFGNFSIEVKQHLPILQKIKLISTIFKSAIDEDDEFRLINYNTLNIVYKVLVVKEYSDVSLPKDTVQAYDLIVQTGLYDAVYSEIPVADREELEEVLRNYEVEHKERYERENTLPNIVKNMLNGLIEKMPTLDEAKEFVEQASKEIEGFDPEKMEFVKEFLAKTSGEV